MKRRAIFPAMMSFCGAACLFLSLNGLVLAAQPGVPRPAEKPVVTTQKHPDGTTSTTTTYPDGVTFTTTRYPTGWTVTTRTYPDGTTGSTSTYPNGVTDETVRFRDGSVVRARTTPDGTTTRTVSGPEGWISETRTTPDGTTTRTVRQQDGTTTTTTTKKNPDGTTTTTTTTALPDGSTKVGAIPMAPTDITVAVDNRPQTNVCVEPGQDAARMGGTVIASGPGGTIVRTPGDPKTVEKKAQEMGLRTCFAESDFCTIMTPLTPFRGHDHKAHEHSGRGPHEHDAPDPPWMWGITPPEILIRLE